MYAPAIVVTFVIIALECVNFLSKMKSGPGDF